MKEYPCPECGHDGPHPVIGVDYWMNEEVECSACYAEFSIPKPDASVAPEYAKGDK